MAPISSRRDPALDVTRCTALLCVIAVHFFVHSSFKNTLLVGTRMYGLTVLRSAAMVCVPLFLMLSGYLLNRKEPNRRYYQKLPKTYSIYALASLCCYCFTCYRESPDWSSFSLLQLVLRTLSFDACGYGWYMNMYWGLFLLIPFLNRLYHGLVSQKEKQGLLLVLLILTAFPKITNCFLYTPDSGWQLAVEYESHQVVLPSWWTLLYPITYYYLGAYLREYPLKITRRQNVLLVLAAFFLTGTWNFLFSYGKEYLYGAWQDWGSPLLVLQSVLFFQLLAQGKYRPLQGKAAGFVAYLSDLCLGGYLVSWIFDELFYPVLLSRQPNAAYQIPYFPVIVLAVFCCSLALSAVLNLVYDLLSKLFTRIFFCKKVTA